MAVSKVKKRNRAPKKRVSFECKIDGDLLKLANKVRKETWPFLVEQMLRRMIAEETERGF